MAAQLELALNKRRTLGKEELASTPDVLAYIENGLEGLNTQLEGYFVVAPTPEVMENKTVIVEDGRPILFRERERRITDCSVLAVGVVAGRKEVPVTNEAVLKGENLDAFFAARERVEGLGIDLKAADHGVHIKLAALSEEDNTRIIDAVEDALGEQLGDKEALDTNWLLPNKFNPQLGRNLKSVPYRITRGEAGRIEAEENPNKRFSRLPLEVAYTVTTLPEIIDENDRAQQARVFAVRNGVQRYLFEAIHRVTVDVAESCITVEEGNFSRQEAETTLTEHPGVFENPVDTHKALKGLKTLHNHILSSGAWLTRPDIFPNVSSIFEFDAFSKSLSDLSPREAQEALLSLGVAADYYTNMVIPDFGKNKEGGESKEGRGTQERKEHVKPESPQKETLGEKLYGLGHEVNPTSVLGVSTMLGLVEKGVVVPLHERRDYDPSNTHVVYGTTDFANPVETIMIRAAAENSDGSVCPATYFADNTSHTIGSYAQRILIPTVTTLYNLPQAEQARLMEVTGKIDAHDMEIASLLRTVGSKELAHYMQQTMKEVGLSQTFKDHYHRMNEALCDRLGIKYIPASELLRRADITVGEAEAYAREIATAAREQFEAMKAKLVAGGLSDEEVNGFLQNIWGNEGAWDIDTRQFFRVNRGEEEEVPFSAVDHSLKFGELADHGITLGGNGWVVFEQLAAERYSPYEHTVLAHKNTRLGVNYSVPPLIAKKTSICVSPIVRVVPDHQNTLGGDGLDIGTYIQYPALIDEVKEAFKTEEGPVNGGQKKVVLAFDTPQVWIQGEKVQVKVIEQGVEPIAGGHRRFVSTKYV